MDLIDDAAAISSNLIEFRHGLHREPELGWHLPQTRQWVIDAIDGLGLEVSAGDEVTR